MQELVTIILATDEGTRMNSSVATVAHYICGKPVLSYVIDEAKQNELNPVVFAESNIAGQVKNLIPDGILCITQENPNNEKALSQFKEVIKSNNTVLFINGNIPAITGDTLKKALDYHLKQGNEVTLVAGAKASHISSPSGNTEQPEEIQSEICFISSRIILHCLEASGNIIPFSGILKKIDFSSNKTGVFYAANPMELTVVRDRSGLWDAESVILKRIIRKHMDNGVTFHLPDTVIIHHNVKIGKDTVIHPGTQIEGDTIIGEECSIGPNSRIQDSKLGNNVQFMNSVMTQSEVGDNTKVGPFAYIRPNSRIGRNIKIGDFVEIKNAVIGDDTKVSHLTYIGDAEVGTHVNFGCGVVVVNYDGVKKHKTFVGDHAFIGCNVNLISPVVVKEHAYIAAGSTITDEVPEYSLAIARSRQTIIADWVKRKGLDKK